MKSDKLPWANDLRAFATIAVIMLHVAASISIEYPDIPKNYFLTSVFFDSAVRWCVPVFIMLTGSFALEHYDGRIKKFFIKMFYRIILPFLFWSMVYLLFFSYDQLSDPHKTAGQLFSFISHQFLVGTASHLWFIYILVSLYITFPFLSRWTKVAVEKEYIYFLSLWIIFLFIEPYIANYDTSFDFSYFSGYLGFLILGNYLIKTQRKFNGFMLVALFLAALLYTALRTYFVSVHKNEYDEDFMDNLSLNIFVMSFCVYLFFKNKKYFTHPLYRKVMDMICLNSYGIYLSHILILNIFISNDVSLYFIHPVLSIPLFTITCLIISFALIWLMKKIPVLKILAG
jgi:Uncharacterized protein conserved in bacteria